MDRRCGKHYRPKAAEEQPKDVNRRKDEFLAMLAHELRNPLAPIKAAAELLQVVTLDEARLRQTIQIVERQVSHMNNLIEDMLDVSRLTWGSVKLDKEPLDIEHVVADAVEQIRPLILLQRHRLEIYLSSNATMVTGDTQRLVQTIANILNNAAKPFEHAATLSEAHSNCAAAALTVDKQEVKNAL